MVTPPGTRWSIIESHPALPQDQSWVVAALVDDDATKGKAESPAAACGDMGMACPVTGYVICADVTP